MGKDGKKSMVLLVLSSTYDKAMATFMTANSALAMDMEVHIYFAFLGVGVVKKGFSPKLPGVFRLVTGFYKKRLRKTGIGDLESQIATARKLGVKMFVCSLCIEAGLLRKEHLREGVASAGFATLVDLMDESDICIVIS